METDKTERIYCRNSAGKDLFYIELTYLGEYDLIFLNCSLEYDINQHSAAKLLIDNICQANLTEIVRSELVINLFDVIKNLPGIHAYYFPNNILSSTGKYQECYARTIKELLYEKDFPDYTVFSLNVNTIYFNYALPHLKNEIHSEFPVYADKTHFEELICFNPELQLEYVELYSPDAEFFIISTKSDKLYDCYIMSVNSVIKMFFIRECP